MKCNFFFDLHCNVTEKILLKSHLIAHFCLRFSYYVTLIHTPLQDVDIL
jgi:hypothetical protein